MPSGHDIPRRPVAQTASNPSALGILEQLKGQDRTSSEWIKTKTFVSEYYSVSKTSWGTLASWKLFEFKLSSCWRTWVSDVAFLAGKWGTFPFYKQPPSRWFPGLSVDTEIDLSMISSDLLTYFWVPCKSDVGFSVERLGRFVLLFWILLKQHENKRVSSIEETY